jgi:hypothetical protein
MAKYSGRLIEAGKGKTALKTSDERTLTHEGAPAWAKDAKTGLFTLAVSSMTAENTFYEDAQSRDSRLRDLVREITGTDPGFIESLVPWLRNVANMRSAPIVIAAEYCLAAGPNRRSVVNSAMARADEPAEFVGYWMVRTGGKTFPGGVQRGLNDAIQRLYTEYGALKYDSGRNSVRMGDVVNLVHPKPKDVWQGSLFHYLLDKRHHGDLRMDTEELPMIHDRLFLQDIPEGKRREYLKSGEFKEVAKTAGITWEWISGWLPGGMDAEAWESVIPQMGYMALLRNLRNFDEAEISEEAKTYIKAELVDPEKVAKSRQFPFRFWSAWAATQTVEWGPVLEKALELSVQNVPEFEGKTLVLVDVSASMTGMTYSKRGTVKPSDVAALFGAAVYAKNPKDTRVAVFGDRSAEVTPKATGSMLRNMEVFRQNHGVGHGTNLRNAAQTQYRGEDRVVIFTDMQTHDGGVSDLAQYTHYFDLGGYAAAPDPVGVNGTFMYGGFTDATFRQMALHEVTRRSDWEKILG